MDLHGLHDSDHGGGEVTRRSNLGAGLRAAGIVGIILFVIFWVLPRLHH